MLGTMAFVVPSVQAKTGPATVTADPDPQIRVQIGGRNRRRAYRRARVVTRTRVVGYGRNRYRETIRVTYLPNGRTRTTVIRRQRVGRY
jgi:hypothetical protein